MADLIKMRRESPVKPGGPTEADVHPSEVENWRAAGWRAVEAPRAAAPVEVAAAESEPVENAGKPQAAKLKNGKPAKK